MYDYDRTASAPRFLDYEHVQAWMEEKIKEYGGKGPFTSSQEFKDAYPEIDKLYREFKKENSAKKVKQMTEAGVAYGDKVRYSQLALLLGGVVVLEGTIVERRGIPYVRLDKPTTGRREVRWHAGFQKV